MPMLKRDQLLQHGIRRDVRFRVVQPLGAGGFGEAYEVVGLGRGRVPVECLSEGHD